MNLQLPDIVAEPVRLDTAQFYHLFYLPLHFGVGDIR